MFLAFAILTTIILCQAIVIHGYRRYCRDLEAAFECLSTTLTTVCRKKGDLQKELDTARKVKTPALLEWQTMALAYEVLCECAVDDDREGAENASRTIRTARDNLKLLGEYDD